MIGFALLRTPGSINRLFSDFFKNYSSDFWWLFILIFSEIFGQSFGQVFSQVFQGQKIQCTVLLGRRTTVYSIIYRPDRENKLFTVNYSKSQKLQNKLA